MGRGNQKQGKLGVSWSLGPGTEGVAAPDNQAACAGKHVVVCSTGGQVLLAVVLLPLDLAPMRRLRWHVPFRVSVQRVTLARPTGHYLN
jgi:hypothetical protein